MRNAISLFGLLALTSAFLPAKALADPECGGQRHRSADCPRSEYSLLHYWTPTLFKARGYMRPSYLDQFAPGPAVPTTPTYEVHKYRCPSIPPTASSPYADPASYYYGRPTTP